MEIIKEPNMQTICQKCGCEFKFNKDEIAKYGGSGRKHIPKQYIGVICPICKTIIKLWEDN